jgi:hypothetical protein
MREHHAETTVTETPTDPRPDPPAAGQTPDHVASHSMWLMLLCCIPMVLIAIAFLLGAFATR